MFGGSTPLLLALKRTSYAGLLVASLMMSMMVGQDTSVRPYSPIFFAIVLPSLLVPALWWREIAAAAMGRSWPLLAFALTAGGWQLITGDYRALLQLFLLVWVLLWISALDLRMSTLFYMILFWASTAVGCAGYFLLGNNPWGFLPQMTSDEFSVWRLSFFPSIVLTGFFSLFVLVAVSESRESFRFRLLTNVAGFYFLFLSFVRTAAICGAVYAPLSIWFSRIPTKWRTLFFVPLVVLAVLHSAIILAPYGLVHLQESQWVARLFLRGSHGLEVKDIFDQISRPWIWQKHVQFFLQSPYLMGLGNFDFYALAVPNPAPGEAPISGSEALLTRLLATYGLPTFFLGLFLLRQLYRNARAGDYVGCAAFPVVIILAMNYGSVLHPSNFLFVLYFQLLIHGRNTFSDGH